MDCDRKYEDFRETHSDLAPVIIAQDPTFDEYDKVLSFDPRKEKTMSFKVWLNIYCEIIYKWMIINK